jgi:hypothetical protein
MGGIEYHRARTTFGGKVIVTIGVVHLPSRRNVGGKSGDGRALTCRRPKLRVKRGAAKAADQSTRPNEFRHHGSSLTERLATIVPNCSIILEVAPLAGKTPMNTRPAGLNSTMAQAGKPDFRNERKNGV